MPQSANVHAEEIHQHAEHTAAAAAVSHGKATHLSGHEETVRAEEHAGGEHHASKLTHGHAASIEAQKEAAKK